MNELDLLNDEDVATINSANECKELLHRKVIAKWQDRWTNSNNGRVTYGFIKDVDFAICRKDFKPNMNLLLLLTEHGSMNEFLFRRGLSPVSMWCE